MFPDDLEARLAWTIAECERIRKLLRDLDSQTEAANQPLLEIEPTSPKSQANPSDKPLS